MTLSDLKSVNLGNKDAAVFINTLYDDTLKSYLKQHRDWYISERFVRGDHWIIYNKTLNKVQTVPVNEGEIRRTINKVKSQLRGVKNFVKRNQPRWEVHPNDITDESYNEARKNNKILQYIYRTRQFPRKLTDVIVNSLKYSVGILEAGVIRKEGKNYLDFWIDDTFDVFFDPLSPSVQDCRYIIKAFKKPLTSILNNKNYTIKGSLTEDNKEAAVQYKELLEIEKYGSDKAHGSKDLDTIIIKEIWIKYNNEEGFPVVVVLTVAGTQLIRVWTTDYKRYPFFIYNPEVDPNAIYSNPWIKDLISINKSLDKTASQIESYIQRMLAGKYLIKQGVEVSSITDKGAEKVYYKGQTAPTQMLLQPLPSTPFAYMQDLERWIEELGGQREASLGRAPSSVQSGKGIEALQSADAQTVAEPIENLEMFLANIGEFCLEAINDFQLTSEEIIEDNEKIKYIGGSQKEIPESTHVVKPSTVKVVIVPEIAYNEENRREWLLRLAEAGLIDEKTLLEKLSISHVGDIIQRMEKKKQEEFKQEMVKQKESHRTSGQAPEDTADLADQENMAMASGQIPPMTPQSLWTPEHTQLHMAFIQQDQRAYQQNQAIFDEHIASEESYSQ